MAEMTEMAEMSVSVGMAEWLNGSEWLIGPNEWGPSIPTIPSLSGVGAINSHF
jgi:hypothetical protein